MSPFLPQIQPAMHNRRHAVPFSGGATCAADADCCNNLCDRPGGAASGTCAALSACSTAGEPCTSEGLSGSCCSTVCLDTTGDGPRCQFLGTCTGLEFTTCQLAP
ncbi:MAG: hypothetical protein JRH11_17105 [Deltaproteobacteria bacterium]|nr:hypothetical protein [Deltaproteobacteria bacterium]